MIQKNDLSSSAVTASSLGLVRVVYDIVSLPTYFAPSKPRSSNSMRACSTAVFASSMIMLSPRSAPPSTLREIVPSTTVQLCVIELEQLSSTKDEIKK